MLAAPVVEEGLADMPLLPDGRAVLQRLSASVRLIVEQHGDVVRLVVTTSPHDSVAASALDRCTTDVRGRLRTVAQHLADRGELRAGLTVASAVDILWFYFGTTSFDTLVSDARWSWDEAEAWLADQSAMALLHAAHHTPGSDERRESPALG